MLGPTDAPQASQPGEILLAGGEDGWYDYEAKYTPGGMELVVPARISDAARERVRELAVTAFRLAGCSGLARADFFVDGEEVLLNELNTMPGFTRRASTASCGKAGCPIRSCATGWWASPSSASSAGGRTGTEAAASSAPRLRLSLRLQPHRGEGALRGARPGRGAAMALVPELPGLVGSYDPRVSRGGSRHGGRPPGSAAAGSFPR